MFRSLRASQCLSLFSIILLFVFLAPPVSAQRRQSPSAPDATQNRPDPLKVLQWRSIGPFRGGRSTAVTGVASQPMVFYFGGGGGGGWETVDGGNDWGANKGGSVVGPG